MTTRAEPCRAVARPRQAQRRSEPTTARVPSPPPTEPAGYTEVGAIRGTPPFANGDVPNGYEGPTSWFSNVAPSPNNAGTINFSPALSPGASTYFALESAPNFPETTEISTTQSAGGASGSTLYLPRGRQSRKPRDGAPRPPTHGHDDLPAPSQPGLRGKDRRLCVPPTRRGGQLEFGARGGPGTYRSRMSYSGDTANAPAITACGGDEIVVPGYGTVGLPLARRGVSASTARLRVRRRAAKSSLAFANGRLGRTLRRTNPSSRAPPRRHRRDRRFPACGPPPRCSLRHPAPAGEDLPPLLK